MSFAIQWCDWAVYTHRASTRSFLGLCTCCRCASFYLPLLQRINITAIQCTDLFFHCFFLPVLSSFSSAFSFSLNIQIFNLAFVLFCFAFSPVCEWLSECLCLCAFQLFMSLWRCRCFCAFMFYQHTLTKEQRERGIRSVSLVAYGIPTKYQFQFTTTENCKTVYTSRAWNKKKKNITQFGDFLFVFVAVWLSTACKWLCQVIAYIHNTVELILNVDAEEKKCRCK